MVLTIVITAVQMMPSAASSGATPFCHISNIVTDTTCEFGPANNSGIETALETIRKMNNQQVITAGAASGKTIRKNVAPALAPDTADTSSSSRWICKTPA